MNKQTPEEIIEALKHHLSPLDPWLVGGAARYLSAFSSDSYKAFKKTEPKDYDIIVSKPNPEELKEYLDSLFEDLPDNFSGREKNTNSGFEGWRLKYIDKFETGQWDVEIWCGDVGRYLSQVPTAYDGIAIQLSSGATCFTSEFVFAALNDTNFEINGRPTSYSPNKDYVKEHLRRQGI